SFFFQAEDGIRDPLVTGVQTCALPISVQRTCRRQSACLIFSDWIQTAYVLPYFIQRCVESKPFRIWQPVIAPSGTCCDPRSWRRSEERRVGKECSVRVAGGN